MTILEFIRKNSLLVLIVIVGVGVGLVMMDYGGKGSAFSREFYIQVNGKSYDYAEAENLGGNGQYYIQGLASAAQSKLRERFDANGDESMDEAEEAAMNAWLQENPDYASFINDVQQVAAFWSYGVSKRPEDNVAINRAVMHEEVAVLGLKPSKEQVDAYIRSMPVFRNADGSFDQALYQRMAGYRNGISNNPTEQAFRSVIEDLMVWEAMESMVTARVSYNAQASSRLIDSLCQEVSGRTAWLPAAAAAKPAAPTEEEIKAFWEKNKDNYKTEERRIVSVYTLAPGEGSNLDALMSTTDIIMQDLSRANGQGLEHMLETAAEDPENAPFTYKTADGATHVTSALCTEAEAAPELQVTVDHNGESVPLSAIAFSEVQSAPTPAEFEAAQKAGTAEKLSSIKQVRGFFPTKDEKLVLMRVEAIEPPAVLPYEGARERALADLNKEREAHALQLAAEKMAEEMTAALADSADAAFEKAKAAGAEVTKFGPVGVGLTAVLPQGMSAQALMSTAKGKLTPLVVETDGARISMVESRTVEDSPDYNFAKLARQLPMMDAQLRGNILLDWLTTAYSRFNVRLSKHVDTGKN